MASSGNPPRSEDPGQEQPSTPGSPPGGPGDGADPPLPSWYRPPSPPAGQEWPSGGEPSSFQWSAPPPQGSAAGEPPRPEQGGEGQPGGEPAPPPPPPGPVFERPSAEPPASEPRAAAELLGGVPPAEPGQSLDAEQSAAEASGSVPPAEPGQPTAAEQPADPEPAPTSGDAAPLAAAGAAADTGPPAWSRSREASPETPAEARADAAEALVPPPPPPPVHPPAAMADAWTTQPETGAPGGRWAPRYARGDHPHLFGDRMAAGVLLTLAAGSMIGGGIAALAASGSDLDSTVRTVICGAVAAVLLAGAVLLRFLRGTEDLRGTLAVTGIAFAAACLVFAYTPDPPDLHNTLVKFALVAGLVTVLSWFAAVAVPSAVAGMIGVVALGVSVGAGVWLLVDQPTVIEVLVAAIGIGLAVALVLPRVTLLRPHPAGLGWALGGAALVVALPAIGLMARQDPLTMAAGATASAALLAVAQRHRNLPAGLGAFAGLAYLEALLVATRTGAAGNSPQGTTQLIVIVAVGVVLVALVAVAAVLERRARPWPGLRRPWPVGITDLLLLAALVLAVVSLFTGNSNLPLNPQQLSPTQTATDVVATRA